MLLLINEPISRVSREEANTTDFSLGPCGGKQSNAMPARLMDLNNFVILKDSCIYVEWQTKLKENN